GRSADALAGRALATEELVGRAAETAKSRSAARAERRGEHGERGCFGPGKGDGTGISATI
ncbi:unnamed protein product, partial [Durusdinium trenchii]